MLRNIACLLILLFAATVAEAGGSFSVTGSSNSYPAEPEPNVELYSTSWCTYCQKARQFFRERGISFTEYDIEKDPDAAYRKQQLDSAGRGVPFAVINGHRIHGYSEPLYLQALEDTQ